MYQDLERICGRLSERRANIFLGAGLNAGLSAPDGTAFPLGEELAHFICTDILEDVDLVLTLDEAAEQARHRIGEPEFNGYLLDLFSKFAPGPAHKLLLDLPWDTIYTTNFDNLLEQAAREVESPIGHLRVMTSIKDDLSILTEDDTPYYKLHGSIDIANTARGRLTITKEDYRNYEQLRQPLFGRLRTDLHSRTFVFLGYSLGDTNFRAVLEDCRTAIGTGTLPLSYAVRPGHRPAEAAFWKDKYNIELLDCTGEEFLTELVSTWRGNSYLITPLEDRESYELIAVDELTAFPKVAECYYQMLPDRCTGKSNPAAFFNGAEVSWADIRDEIAPPRDILWDILEGIFTELLETQTPPASYLVAGHAGTGKSTVLRTLAYVMAQGFDTPVLVHISGTPLNAEHVRSFCESHVGKRVIILVHNGAEICEEIARFHQHARQMKLPLTLLIEERTNQWNAAISRCYTNFSPNVYELGPLSENEIELILDALTKHDALGALGDSDRATQIQHFTAVADKVLLVALRELTSGDLFDKIVADEFSRIPSDLGKEAYEYVASIGQVGLYMRYNTLAHLLGCGVQTLAKAVFPQTEGILLSSDVIGSARHTIGYKVRARHPIIASIVFAASAPTDMEKYSTLSAVISNLDPGFREDQGLLQELVRRRDLVRTFARPEYQRAIYDLLAEALPGDPYVLQHRSILERELGDSAAAVGIAREAVRSRPTSMAFRNTLGFALTAAARDESELTRKKAMLLEASKIFEREIESVHTSGFAYLGLAQVRRQEFESEKSPKSRQELQLETLALLETAREEANQPEVVEREYAQLRSDLGDREGAIRALSVAVSGNPKNPRIRDLLVRFLVEASELDPALDIARTGIKYAPTEWRLYRHIGRILDLQGASTKSVRENYEAAVRYNRRSTDVLVEYGGFLFRRSEYPDASEIFKRANTLAETGSDKSRIRYWWKDERGRKLRFSGRVIRLGGSIGFVEAIPEGFEAAYWRHHGINQGLAENSEVQFSVGFSTFGARANIVRRNMRVK